MLALDVTIKNLISGDGAASLIEPALCCARTNGELLLLSCP